LTVAISLAAMNDHSLKAKLMFNAYAIKHNKEWYRFFSSGLIHGDYMHLGFNMYAFWMFGGFVERAFLYMFDAKSVFFFILLYVGALAMSSTFEYERNKNNPHYNALGASGAVSAIIFASIMIAPTQTISFIVLPIPIPAYIFGVLFLVAEYYMDKKGNSNIGHNAHFWGAIFGVIYTLVLKPQLFINFFNQILG
jgi:membrane associated rhomboid family serine protease